jgi:hypothetical protein
MVVMSWLQVVERIAAFVVQRTPVLEPRDRRVRDLTERCQGPGAAIVGHRTSRASALQLAAACAVNRSVRRRTMRILLPAALFAAAALSGCGGSDPTAPAAPRPQAGGPATAQVVGLTRDTEED